MSYSRTIPGPAGERRLRVDLDPELAEVGGVDGRGGTVHERGRAGRLRERDGVADGFAAVKEDHQPVEAERDAAVGRSAVLERFEQEPELGAQLLGRHSYGPHDRLLDVLPMDADASARELVAIGREIVELRAHAAGIGGDVLKIVVERHGEDVMGRRPRAARLVALEERELVNPYETEIALVEREAAAAQLGPKL